MLSRLHIQNFALIDNIAIEFVSELNVLTGETGAGKSILLDALSFALGERFDGLRPKNPAKPCSVEAVFEPDKKLRREPALAQFLEDEDILILRREVTTEGRGRAWINNRTATTAALKEVGNLLVDIHGQHDHQLLLDPASHLGLLDRFSKNEELLKEYSGHFTEYREILRQKEELKSLEEGREREIDLLKYQINEIEQLAPEAGEEDELKAERIRLANAEKLHETTARVLELLNDEDASASNLIGKAARDIHFLAKLDPSTEEMKNNFESAQLALEEVLRTIREYQESLSFDADRLEEIDERLDRLELIKRKYGGSVDAAVKFLAEAKAKYDKLENAAVYEKDIEKKMKQIEPKLKSLASEISEKRKKTAASLKRTIEEELKDLNIPQAVFECRVEKTDFNADGIDKAEFMVSLNPGQGLLPLRKIISGGEASRVMLAMKKALMKVDSVPTLIFDEIDANIGGRLGTVTGEKLKEIAGERQVLLITHLPQIASFASRHFRVAKKIKQGQTFVDYEVIEGGERVKELAQMMSGKHESDISKKHAEEMLTKAGKN